MYKYKYGMLQKVYAHIKNGGIIAYPTESCYGFGCDPFNYKSLNTILNLKGRIKAKGMICIASNIKQLNKLIMPLSNEDNIKLKKYWPGFYSIILPSNKHVTRLLVGTHDQIATRVSTHNEVMQLCNHLKMSIVSTSANKSGHKSIKTYRECSKKFGSRVMVLPGIIGGSRKPSTIIDFATMRFLR